TSWVLRYIRYHGVWNPAEMAEAEVMAFLTWLAETRRVSYSTQTQATSAVLFLHRQVLGRQLNGVRQDLRGQWCCRGPCASPTRYVRRRGLRAPAPAPPHVA